VAGRSSEDGYGVGVFTRAEFVSLAVRLAGQFILWVNDVPEIKSGLADFPWGAASEIGPGTRAAPRGRKSAPAESNPALVGPDPVTGQPTDFWRPSGFSVLDLLLSGNQSAIGTPIDPISTRARLEVSSFERAEEECQDVGAHYPGQINLIAIVPVVIKAKE
jgi:hypothetical protein